MPAHLTMTTAHRYHMTRENALHLVRKYCTISSRENRRAAIIALQMARVARENWSRCRDNWHYSDAYKARHATVLDWCRIHRRAAELVAQHGYRSETNAYPVSL